MRRPVGPYVLLVFILTIGLCACGPTEEERDEIYEVAFQHFLKERSVPSDTLVIDFDGVAPSDESLSRLNDVGVYLMSLDEAKRLHGNESECGSFSNVRELSVRRRQWPWEMLSNPWWWLDSEVVAVSIYNPSADAYGDVYGVEYRMQKPEGEWIVVEKGAEWMNGV